MRLAALDAEVLHEFAAIGRGVPPNAAFEWPTVAEMAHYLDAMFAAAAVADGADRSSREELTL